MMSPEKKDLNDLVAKIAELKDSDFFPKYIDQIYFPFYKGFKEFSQINFDYPLTVIVGKNGSGKSSILHALYGCPLGNSPADFWFSSATDPIQDGDGKHQAQCFVYSYHSDGDTNQVLMKRSSRPGTKTKRKNPDYWETDKPRRKYHMQGSGRRPPIEWKNIYIDFRQELSAYDKFIYFGNMARLKSVTKQDFIRRVSTKLNTALEDPTKIYHVHGRRQNDSCVELNKKELYFISHILGVHYVSGKLIRHHLFRNWGLTAFVTKNGFSYTEAHAGSGEFAVISLVHQLSSLGKNDSRLILLDEPETSLYPGAQQRLLGYLLKIIQETRSQIVISTHSENFISSLPDCAVKAIRYNSKSEKTDILDSCSPSSVFSELEVPNPERCTIIVEDRAARTLLEAIIETNEQLKGIIVRDIPGGANTLIDQMIPTSSQRSQWDEFYLLDGDQNSSIDTDIDNQPIAKVENQEYINLLAQQISPKIRFPSSEPRKGEIRPVGIGDPIKFEAQKKYLRFFSSNVGFLPAKTPEDVVWDESYFRRLFNASDIQVKLDASRKKDSLHALACAEVHRDKVNDEVYYSFFQRICAHWVNTTMDSSAYKEIVATMTKFKLQFENTRR